MGLGTIFTGVDEARIQEESHWEWLCYIFTLRNSTCCRVRAKVLCLGSTQPTSGHFSAISTLTRMVVVGSGMGPSTKNKYYPPFLESHKCVPLGD